MTSDTKSLKLLFVSTSVGPLGTGLGGGVELTVRNIAQEMLRRGHQLARKSFTSYVLGMVNKYGI